MHCLRTTLFSTLFCLSTLSACGSAALNPNPNPSVTPSAQPSSSPYTLPLKLATVGECEIGNHTVLEIQANGTLRYTPEGSDTATERTLTAEEQNTLLTTLLQADLAKKAQDDTTVPADAPQTRECRVVDQLTLQTAGSARTFDRNGRTLRHSASYLEAFAKIQAELDKLMQPSQGLSYGLPFKMALVGECELPSFTRYEIKANGTFVWTREDWPTFAPGNPPTQERVLSATEIKAFTDELAKQDPITALRSSEAIPDDAPQTMECRTAEVYTLTSNGSSETFEGQGSRKLRHSEATLNKLKAIQAYLTELAK
jgi:hypothetical protein